MRVITRAVLDIESLTWDSIEYEDYDGPWELADRAASNAAKTAGKTAAGVASNEESNANSANATLSPFYRQEMTAQHAFNPAQTNELLNAAEAPLAGSGATAAGGAASEAARTRNTSGFSSSLDQNARDRQKALSNASLGVGQEDILGAKQLNQEGAAGLSGLYNTDTNAMLKAMGVQTEDINAQTQAGKSGWFQNTLNAIGTLAGGAKNGAQAFQATQ